ncbi:hypothetical protein [Rhodopila sp.]|uniref:hypothetical protein n=1 Tax=Rhodopila sp. TaxID=2480087 RepID=UPI003D12A074
MLIPKASHLVERVAERLLRNGGLDTSAAQLLRPSATPMPEPVDQPAVDVSQRSSLFATPQPTLLEAAWTEAPADAAAQVSRLTEIRSSASSADCAAEAVAPEWPVKAPVVPPPRPPVRAIGSEALPAPSLSATLPTTTSDPTAEAASSPVQTLGSVDAVSLERAGMVDWSRTRSRISEEFRLVQRQILRSAFGPDAEPGFSNLLMVTSARPGEGKSFMSLNIAGSIARQNDNHVLFVDADSKRDSLCYSLGLAQARGLLDLASDPKLDPASLILKCPIERLSILPIGRERERSAELFSTKEMTQVIQSLGRRYADRLLILDAPPCLSTSDPALLAQVVGQILFVVEADRTQRDEVEASLDLIQACPTITMVLNKQQMSSRYTFGAYSSYYSV